MSDFSTSLSGDVVMTEPTRLLLQIQYPVLEFCGQVHTLEYGQLWQNENVSVELLTSNHMLGSAQTKVTLNDSTRLGYSGDFGWPLDEIIQVDALVVDSTYGKPDSGRAYTQQQAQIELCELISKKLRDGPLHILGDSGPLDRALHILLMMEVLHGVPVVGTKRHAWSTEVHKRFGIELPEILIEGTQQARHAAKEGCYVRLWGLHSREINDGLYPGSVIKLTKFRTVQEPIEKIGDNTFIAGLSNHADFDGTMEYVYKTGAQLVITDNLRGHRNGRGETLANTIREQLGVESYSSTNRRSRAWGE